MWGFLVMTSRGNPEDESRVCFVPLVSLGLLSLIFSPAGSTIHPSWCPLPPSLCHCSPAFSALYAPCLPQAKVKSCLFSQQLPSPVVPY